MSDTPETDEHIWVYAEYDNRKLVDAEFARKLERERDILKKHISIMDASHKTANDEYFKLAVENENLERKRDNLRNELNDTIRSCHIWQDGHSKIVEDRDYWKAEAERWKEIKK